MRIKLHMIGNYGTFIAGDIVSPTASFAKLLLELKVARLAVSVPEVVDFTIREVVDAGASETTTEPIVVIKRASKKKAS